MANVRRRANGSFEIRAFIGGKRRSFYPGPRSTKKQAESVGGKLEKLAFAVSQSEAPSSDVAEWLKTLTNRQHAKLASWGLIAPREPREDEQPRHEPEVASKEQSQTKTLRSWLEEYLGGGSWAPGTREQLERTRDNLLAFFDGEKAVQDFDQGDAEDFRVWLQTKAKVVPEGSEPAGLAHNTVRRRIGRAKQIFRAAVKRKYISENPFSDEASATGANVENHRYIPAIWIDQCIEAAPCEDWRIILALARYGGLRSHETRILRWQDVDMENRRMIVRSNKTPPTRICPIFPELYPHLERAYQVAPKGAITVQNRYTATSNIQTQLYRILEAAGLERWPDAFQNLRRSRETELMGRYPVKDVAGWIGNSVPVAMKHYAVMMKTSFDEAVANGAGGMTPISPQFSPHSQTLQGHPAESGISPEPENTGEKQQQSVAEGEPSYPARTRKTIENAGEYGKRRAGGVPSGVIAARDRRCNQSNAGSLGHARRKPTRYAAFNGSGTVIWSAAVATTNHWTRCRAGVARF
ncbi:MAG: tyrosine-type recombinase/integrase [Planctomycetota bacterium]